MVVFGFDLDGVLCNIDVALLHIMHKLPPEQEKLCELYYYTERTPLLDPHLFLSEGDEYHIITGRHILLKDVTEKWCRRFFPDAKSVNIVGGEPWYYYEAAKHGDPVVWERYAEKAIMSKVEKIKELGVDVYIDDSPSNVRRLRKELPDVIIIQYGGRLK